MESSEDSTSSGETWQMLLFYRLSRTSSVLVVDLAVLAGWGPGLFCGRVVLAFISFYHSEEGCFGGRGQIHRRAE